MLRNLRPYIIGTNLLNKFHDDWTINVASRVLTSHVFQPTRTTFKLIQDIFGTNLLTIVHKDRTINWPLEMDNRQSQKLTMSTWYLGEQNVPFPWFHDDGTINVASIER
ncbi:hypothetical protein DPMN_141973 [Dreissena polymorpha]|uniref:Uncharacterized protein n=1 Tax=Dreissena polymorpha TaxID=45954 RepID=A0A9D4GGD3_DREPO|nr:hypothetical protein DPMN_141973 [Dreissena polymorpha]